MTSNLLTGLTGSSASVNGVKVRDLSALFQEWWKRNNTEELQGRVLVVKEHDAIATIGMMMTAWQRGVVPLLSASSLNEYPWWKADSGSYLVPEEVSSTWDIPDTCALLQATSGSSGIPQLAMRSHESLYWESEAYANAWGSNSNALVHCVRLEHSFGIGISLSALLADRDVSHMPPIRANRLADFGDRIGVLAGTPSTLRIMNAALPIQGFLPDTVFCGAGSLSLELRASMEQRWGSQVVMGFGSTETGGVLAGIHGIGAPVLGAELVDNVSIAPGDSFQLKVKVPHQVLGYVGRPNNSRTWVFPDLVRRMNDGSLIHVARTSRTLRHRDQSQTLGHFSDVLKAMNRDWRLLEPNSEDTKSPCLLIEGEPLEEWEKEQLYSVGDPNFGGMEVRTLSRFPRNDIGKVELSKLFSLHTKQGNICEFERQ